MQPNQSIVVDCEPKLEPHWTAPDKATVLQYERWLSLLPELQAAYLQHLLEAIGVPMYLHQTFSLPPCSSLHCMGPKTAKVLCLYLDHKSYFAILFVLLLYTQTLQKGWLSTAPAPHYHPFLFAMVSFPLPLTSHVLPLHWLCSTSASHCLSVHVMPFMHLHQCCALSMNDMAFIYKTSR